MAYDAAESNISDIYNVVSIDRGSNFIAATCDSQQKSGFINDKHIKQTRAKYSNLCGKLKMYQTPSSRRRIKAVCQREKRWMQDINHQASKALVAGNPKHTPFAIKDLPSIRTAAGHIGIKDRYFMILRINLSTKQNRIRNGVSFGYAYQR